MKNDSGCNFCTVTPKYFYIFCSASKVCIIKHPNIRKAVLHFFQCKQLPSYKDMRVVGHYFLFLKGVKGIMQMAVGKRLGLEVVT